MKLPNMNNNNFIEYSSLIFPFQKSKSFKMTFFDRNGKLQ